MKVFLPLLLLFVACATDPGYQSFYVGDGNLQWFVQPVPLEKAAGDSVVVDFTYRRIRGQENWIRVNLSWTFEKIPHELPELSFELPGQESAVVTSVQTLYQERSKNFIRYTGMMKEADFLRVLKDPHGDLRLEEGGRVIMFATGPAFERVLKKVAFELS